LEIGVNRHADVLLFQVANWLSGFVWFSAFLRLTSPQAFAQIAAAELMFGFFGVFITNLSLRLQGECRTQARERRLLALRLGALALVAAAAALGAGSPAGVMAMVSIALTPAHLPLLLGHQPWLLVPLLARIPLALAALYADSPQAPAELLAAIYFGPGILYGLLAYRHYFRLLPDEGPVASLRGPLSTHPFALAGQFLATAAANQIQAHVVSGLVLAQPGLALVERLLRSAHSFAFPHLLRRGLLTPRVRILLGVISVTVILGLTVFTLQPASGVFLLLPTLLDAYSTIAAGSLLSIDLLFLAAAVLFLVNP
jgi:hypothetical protein